MTLAFAAALILAVTVPHALPLERAAPVAAAVVWFSALVLRTVMVVAVVMWIVVFLPATEVFTAVSHWCWHAVVPVLATHLGVSGHALADVATLAPAMVLAASAVSAAAGLWRAASAVRRLIRRDVMGRGPADSLIVRSGEVVVASAGLPRPQVLVSAGALVALDDEELAASLDHERGHIRHRHHHVLVVAELCRGIARFLPGTSAALKELRLHLERDADAYVVRRRHDPLALASAICKVAGARTASPALLALGGSPAARRVDELTGVERRPRGTVVVPGFAALMATLALAAAVSVPVAIAGGPTMTGSPTATEHCLD